MSINGRIERLEQGRAQRLERDRQNFRLFLRGLDREGKRRFFERVLTLAPGLLPEWSNRGITPFDLPPTDPRCAEWLNRLASMQIDPVDAADQFLHRLAREFRREAQSM